MTTKVTVDAHAGWPVKVVARDYYPGNPTETELATVAPGTVQDFHVHSSRELIITELSREPE